MSQFKQVTEGPVDPGTQPAGGAAGVVSVAGRAGAVVLTKADVGLALADNTPDAGKPVSAAQAAADAAVAAQAAAQLAVHTSSTSNPHSTTKAQVGLGNADNTSDANKPVSTAQASAIAMRIAATEKGAANGVATLDAASKIPLAQIPDGISSGNGTSNRRTITQNGHGFAAKQAVYDNGGTWALARANALATARVTGVVESATTNAFVVVYGGELPVAGWAANTQYFLSDATAGLLVPAGSEPTDPASFVTPVARTGPATGAYVEIGEPLSLALIPNTALATNPLARANHTGTQSADTVTDGTANKAFTAAEQAKLAGIAAGAQANAPLASQADAEAGLENTKTMTSLRTSQAIAAAVPPVTREVRWQMASATLPAGWSLTGANGIPAVDTPDSDIRAIVRLDGQVAAPVLGPAGGSYGSASVTIASSTPGATIKYTTNGSTPSRSNGTTYTSAIAVNSSQTIKAIAYKDYWADSAVVSESYAIAPTLVSAAILANGTTLREIWSEAIAHGAGGSGGAALTGLSGGATTLSSPVITGAQRDLTISRTVLASETGGSYAYAQPGNGIEAASGGADAASFSGASVTNSSTQGAFDYNTPANLALWLDSRGLAGLSDGATSFSLVDPFDGSRVGTLFGSGTTKQTVNGKPVVRFDLSGGGITTPAVLSSAFDRDVTFLFIGGTGWINTDGGHVWARANGQLAFGLFEGVNLGQRYNSWFGQTSNPQYSARQVVAMTYDGVNLKVYRNGVLLDSYAKTDAIGATGAITIAGQAWPNFFAGDFAAFAVYNRALTPTELASITAKAATDFAGFAGTNTVFHFGDSMSGTFGGSIDYVSVVKADLAAASWPYLYHWAAAAPGRTIEGVQAEIPNDVPKFVNPVNLSTREVAVLWIGTNNVHGGDDGPTAIAKYTALRAALAAQGFNRFVHVTCLAKTGETGGETTARNAFNAHLASLADANNVVVPIHTDAALDDPSDTTYFFDGLHLKDAGKTVVGHLVATAIQTL
jgi:hypothetical protein